MSPPVLMTSVVVALLGERGEWSALSDAVIARPPAPWWYSMTGWSLLVGVLGAAMCLCVLVWLWTRWSSCERVYAVLTRRLWIGRAQRVTLRRLAFYFGQAEPATLTLSRRAYREAVNATLAAGGRVDPRRLERLEKRLFG